MFYHMIHHIAAVPVGDLPTFMHRVSGTLQILSPTTLNIRNFDYDGLGPGELSGWIDGWQLVGVWFCLLLPRQQRVIISSPMVNFALAWKTILSEGNEQPE
jgi:hypothetical protein